MKILSFGSLHMVDELDFWNVHFCVPVLHCLPTASVFFTSPSVLLAISLLSILGLRTSEELVRRCRATHSILLLLCSLLRQH